MIIQPDLHIRTRMYTENGMIYISRRDQSNGQFINSTIAVGELDPLVISKGYQMLKNYLI